jgi:FG-GAP-like repeat
MTKKRKRRLVYLAVFLFLTATAGLWAKLEIDHIDAEAEKFAATGQAAIALLGEYQAGMGRLDVGQVLACYDPAYANEREGYWQERLRSDRDGVRVYDWYLDGARPFTRDDVAGQLAHYFAGKRSVEESKFKLNAVEAIPRRGEAVVRAILWLRGTTTAGHAFECHSLFRLWLRTVDGAWKIHKQELVHGETVTGDRTGFTDVTASAGITFRARHNPLWQTPEWQPKMFGIIKYGSAGVTAVDFDNDGWYDIFFCDGQHPRLYRNNGDGTFTDATAQVGLPDEVCGCNVAIFADFNNDGYKDLFIGVGTGPNRLYRNDGPDKDGRFHFTDLTEGAGLGGHWVTVAAAADYDNDGKIDLYLGRYLDPRRNLPTTLFYTRNGEGNTLLKNEGNFRFRDVTAEAGVREGGLTLGVAWGDFDNDGYQDLFVANDFGRNALLRNNGDGTFTDVSKETGALDFGFSMSATFGDVNNDGHLDIYASKVHSGQRWYGQAPTMHKYLLTSYRQGTLSEDLSLYRELYGLVGAEWHVFGDRTVRGNSLLLNDGHGRFRDVAEETRSNPFGWYWGAAVFDYDNDGLQDIYAVNGWITGRTDEDL